MGTEGLKGALLVTLVMVLLVSLSAGEVHASPDWTATWDTTSDWKGGTYENARVYNGRVDIGLYPPEPHFDGSSWNFYTYEITEVDALYADYKSGQAYFYARDKSVLSSETGEAYAYAQDIFYLDSAGVGTETLEFWWKGYSEDFNQGDSTTTLTIQLQRPGETVWWHNLWSKTFDNPSTGAEGTETVNIPASLLDNSGNYKMRIYVYWYFDVTGIWDTEEFEWYVKDISFGFNRAEHTTQWRSMGAMSAWKTLEASARISPVSIVTLTSGSLTLTPVNPVSERITARIEVSDDGIHVDDYKEISLKNGTNTYYITDLKDARYVRVRTWLYGYYESHTPELDKYIVTADPIPSLSSGRVTPSSNTPGSAFTYTVEYTDPDGDEPSYVNVYIDGAEYNMTKISGTYTGGATYRYMTNTLTSGSHSYYFWASDGTSSVRLPTSGSYDGPEVIPLHELNVSANPTEGGNITLDPPGGTYTKETIVTLTAHPASGYEFDYWSGDASGSSSSISLTMDSDKNVIAHFTEESWSVTLTFYKSSGGLLTNTTIYYGTSEGHETSYLGPTDSQGKITSTNSALADKTIYFKSSEGTYAGSKYIGSSGGTYSITLREAQVVLPLALAAFVLVLIACAVGGAVAIAWKRRLPKAGAPKRKVKPLEMAKPKEHKPRTKGTPYQSPMAETYFEVFRSAAKEKLAKSLPKVKHREMPTKPFEKR